jgi:hypothetical protein
MSESQRDAGLQEFLKTRGSRPVTYRVLVAVLDAVLRPLTASWKTQRDAAHAELAALKVANQQLRDRVLQLEAIAVEKVVEQR